MVKRKTHVMFSYRITELCKELQQEQKEEFVM